MQSLFFEKLYYFRKFFGICLQGSIRLIIGKTGKSYSNSEGVQYWSLGSDGKRTEISREEFERGPESTEHEPDENIEGITGYGSVVTTSVAGAESLVKIGETGIDAVKLAETTERVFKIATRGFALLDVGISYAKYKNGQISGVHLAVNMVANAFTFIGFPEVTVLYGLVDMGLDAFGIKW